MTLSIHRAAFLAVVAASAIGCGGHPGARSAAPVTSAPAPLAPLVDDRWGRFRSQRLGLSVPLPDGALWRIDDHSAPWLVARHPDTGTVFRARVWNEPRPVSRETCEAVARGWAPELPTITRHGTIDEHVIVDTPAAGFESLVTVGLHDANAARESVGGHVLAFGVSGKKCVVMAFTTSVQGPKGSAVMGARLELGARIVEGTILIDSLPRGPLVAPGERAHDHR